MILSQNVRRFGNGSYRGLDSCAEATEQTFKRWTYDGVLADQLAWNSEPCLDLSPENYAIGLEVALC